MSSILFCLFKNGTSDCKHLSLTGNLALLNGKSRKALYKEISFPAEAVLLVSDLVEAY
ncbi:hypothetical protein KHA80_23065 [Anaerobacillus sp. HL2]|nr:hypothetical protein KHA80_23065 [Anaerobacillus sp. HL2]